MASSPHKRSSREIAEGISKRILNHINSKSAKFEKAEKEDDWEAMIVNKLTKAEQAFVQAQQKLDQDADVADHAMSQLDGAELADLQKMFDAINPKDN
jgi:hypothetical protein